MITKQEIMSILVELEDKGVEIGAQWKAIAGSREIPESVLKFIVQNKGHDVANFYEMLRKKHNLTNSPLYLNLVRGGDTAEDSIITLSSLLTQIALFAKHGLTDKERFYKHVRAAEIATVLVDYYANQNTSNLEKLLNLIKCDILMLEYYNGRRELA